MIAAFGTGARPVRAQTPPRADALAAWLDPDSLSSLNDGAGVASWPDTGTEKKNHAVQANPASQPLYVKNGLNGHGVVRFDGTDDQLALPQILGEDFCVFVVYRSFGGRGTGKQWTDAAGILDADAGAGASDFGFSLDATGRVVAGAGSPDVSVHSPAGFNDGAPHIAVFRRVKQFASLILKTDGVFMDSAKAGNQPLTAAPRTTLGSLQTNLNYFGGDVAEVLAYRSPLDYFTMEAVEAYLSQKYAIPLLTAPASPFPYFTSFEGVIGPEWERFADVVNGVTPRGGRRFLGPLNQVGTHLLLTGLPPHDTLHLSFDLFVIGPWVGNDTVKGPNLIQVKVQDGPTLLDTTFSNTASPQSYPKTDFSGSFPPRSGATERDTLGYPNPGTAGDTVYHFEIPFAHAQDFVKITFNGVGLHWPDTEQWGLDNVRLTVPGGAPMGMEAVQSVRQPGPPLFTDVRVSPNGPYKPGAEVAVSADVTSALPLKGVTAQAGDAAPVPLARKTDATGAHWIGKVTFPANAERHVVLEMEATDSSDRRDHMGRALPIVEPPPPPAADWIVLAHGFDGFRTGAHPQLWKHLTAYMAGAGKAQLQSYVTAGLLRPDYKIAVVDTMNTRFTFKNNAARLHRFLQDLPVQEADRILLVGHGSGGVIAQMYMSLYAKTSPRTRQVRRLVQVDPPSAGTPLGDLGFQKYLKSLRKHAYYDRFRKQWVAKLGKGFKELSTAASKKRLKSYRRKAVPSSIVTGYCGSVSCKGVYDDLHPLLQKYLKKLHDKDRDDGLVPVTSMKKGTLSIDRFYSVPGADHSTVLRTPAGMTAILAGLFAQDAPGGAAGAGPLQADPDEEDDPHALIATHSEFIGPGEEATVPLPLAGEKGVVVTLTFLDNGGDATLSGPTGIVPPTEQDAFTASWDVGDAAPGDWTLTLSGMGIDDEPTPALVFVGSTSGTAFDGEASPELAASGPVVLRASLDPGAYAPGIVVKAAITRETGIAAEDEEEGEGEPAPEDPPADDPTDEVGLKDDGIAPDEAAGDGIFSGQYLPPGDDLYSVEFTATGKTPGGADLVRDAGTTFEVLRPTGDVNGDGGVDVSDVILVLQDVVGLDDLIENAALQADMNADDAIDVTDAIVILRLIVGLPPV